MTKLEQEIYNWAHAVIVEKELSSEYKKAATDLLLHYRRNGIPVYLNGKITGSEEDQAGVIG